MTTICTACRWYRNTKAARRGGPPASMWYYQLCTHPDVEHPTTIDPVSGEALFMTQNDLGKTIVTDEGHPFCRDINDGECKLFESRPTVPAREEQAKTMTRYSSLGRWNGMHFQLDWTHEDYWRAEIEKDQEGERAIEWSVLVRVDTGAIAATWTKTGGFVFRGGSSESTLRLEREGPP